MSRARPDTGAAGSPGARPALEQILADLEAAVRRLSDPSAPLERLVRDWETAQALAAEAERRLQEVERQLQDGQSGTAVSS